MDWDPAKRLSNLQKHGLDFWDAAAFDFDGARIDLDAGWTPQEPREIATGFCGNRICVLVYVRRSGSIRLISFRAATRREARDYVDAIDRET